MTQCFELLSLRLIIKTEHGESDEFGSFWLSDDGMAAFDIHLQMFGIEAETVLWRTSQSVLNGDYPPPWAIIAFDRDYPVGCHLQNARGANQAIKYASFNSLRDKPTQADRNTLSAIVVMTKDALGDVAARSPFLQPYWEILRFKNEMRRWLLLAEPLSADLIRSLELLDPYILLEVQGGLDSSIRRE